MKNICKLYFALLVIACLSGCDDKLNVEPYTFISDDMFYKTEAHVESALNSVYSTLIPLYDATTSGLYGFCEMRSDNTDFEFYAMVRASQTFEAVDKFIMASSNTYLGNLWNNLYETVQQANVLLERIGDVPFADPKLKAQYEGEARFLRALVYFHLVRLYGGVPLRTESTKGPGNAHTETRASVDQVYALILQDLKFAIDNLPTRSAQRAADRGRATQGAALAMQGEIYLTLKDYANAITSLEKVTGYSLLTDYASIFHPSNKNNAESVFEVQYNSALNMQSQYIFSWGPRYGRVALTGFTGNLGGWNKPTLDIIEAYEPEDLRKDASIAYWVNPQNAEFVESFGENLDSAVYINKFYHQGTYLITGRADENFPVYRFAYVKLMLADALNEMNRSAEALPLLNEVRTRAGLADFTSTNQAELREAIFKETRVEVAFENHRWYQLLRSGRAVEIMNAHGEHQKARFKATAPRTNPRVGSHLADDSYDVKPYMLLYPIPERELRLNPTLTNNPGW